jgi:EH domain-containing protein 1
MGRSKKPVPARVVTSIVDGLKAVYFTKVKPLEEMFKFGSFFSPLLHESDFEAKPSVLLLGQYSTGKTTFIKYLLGRDYPGCHIGPEPTTDRFVVVMHGLEERRVPGNTLAVQPDRPYQGLSMFGTGFLSRCAARGQREASVHAWLPGSWQSL